MIDAPLRLWAGHTLHKRFVPFERAFRYRIVLIDLDIDRLEDARRSSLFFAVNKPGLFSFYERDHGSKDLTCNLRQWAEGMYAQAGVSIGSGSIRLVTFPRHLFYKFAPISLWYGYDEQGHLKGIIYEVNNTFGDRHCYVAAVEDGRNVHVGQKNLHVSPFFDVSGAYRFTLNSPARTLDVVVENFSEGNRLHLANIKARALGATSRNLLRLAVLNPLSSLGVTFAIHWQALRLWFRGARYHKRPHAPAHPATVAVPHLDPVASAEERAA